ncbi:MAG: hypothetical protein ACLTDO_05080 [Bifidobacterium pseudocatenulatum]
MKHRKPTPAWQKLGLRVSKKPAVGATALPQFGGLAVASVSHRRAPTVTVMGHRSNPTFEAARKKYGLTKEMKNGAILHAWMWSFHHPEHMDEIAEAGLPPFRPADEQNQGERQRQENSPKIVLCISRRTPSATSWSAKTI